MGQGTPHSLGLLKDQGYCLDPVTPRHIRHRHVCTHACLAELTRKLIIYNVAEDSFKIRKWNTGLIETVCSSLSGEERVA